MLYCKNGESILQESYKLVWFPRKRGEVCYDCWHHKPKLNEHGACAGKRHLMSSQRLFLFLPFLIFQNTKIETDYKKCYISSMQEYNHLAIEPKWQKYWEDNKTYQTQNPDDKNDGKIKPKKYVLDMFPYPSGQGLHVGHPRGYIASDVYARLQRMKGFNVLHPMGFDSFGLPAEQYAIQTGNNPAIFTDGLVKHYKQQLEILGFSFDWSRQVETHNPKFYKWTQWIFLKLYGSWYDLKSNQARSIDELTKIFTQEGNKNISACGGETSTFSADEWQSFSELQKQEILMNYRLAYEGESEVNWSEDLGTVLANDEIIQDENGKPVSERGGYPVTKKKLRQWFLRITAYADRLLAGLDTIDWSDNIKTIERNWIGKSEGAEFVFNLKDSAEKITVFTTRADTLFGVTYVVLAPENELVQKLKSQIQNWDEVERYIADAKLKDDIVRTAEDKEKTGVKLEGVVVINPANQEVVPVFVADYVLNSYGTGAVMAVPAHDIRDFKFAQKYNLPIHQVIAPTIIDQTNPPREDKKNTTRKVAMCIIKHPTEDKYLSLKWNNHYWHNFVTGGIEDGEDALTAAKREIVEETGYLNAEYIRTMPLKVNVIFYAAHKDVNRDIITNVFEFKLKDLTQTETQLESHEDFKPIWIERDEIKNLAPLTELPFVLNWLDNKPLVYTEEGQMINSDSFDGISSSGARDKITTKFGKETVRYKMRDAVFARQRYWGEPIPLKHTAGTITPLTEAELPLVLPQVESYAPSGNGESPLANVSTWVKAGYETNTMPGWAGSSWYFLRYMDPQNSQEFASQDSLDYWQNVDMYVGGSEHATGHLLYARFWHKFLKDLGYAKTEEPFQALRNQGMILGTDHRKMSKRWGNVINPDDVVKRLGADTLRVFECFLGPFHSSLPWSEDGIIGSRRFIERVWKLQAKVVKEAKGKISYENLLHKTIKKVGEDIESFNFNTAISAMMILVNEWEKSEEITQADFLKFLQILAPFASHITEELWQQFGGEGSIHLSDFPKFDETKMVDTVCKIAVQVNGKVRVVIETSVGAIQEEVVKLATQDEKVTRWLKNESGEELTIKKIIFVPDKILGFVVGE